MKIQFGCTFHGEQIVVVQISEEIDNSLFIANEMKRVLQKENIRRERDGKPKIAYKIATSEKLGEQFPEVAKGGFRLTEDETIIQEADMGMVFFGSNPVLGIE